MASESVINCSFHWGYGTQIGLVMSLLSIQQQILAGTTADIYIYMH